MNTLIYDMLKLSDVCVCVCVCVFKKAQYFVSISCQAKTVMNARNIDRLVVS